MCLQPPSYVGNRGNVWHVAVAGLKGAAGCCLEVLEVQTLCARRLSQSRAVSLRSLGKQCFPYTQGSGRNSQQGTGFGRASLLLELPAQPCWSCLSACPVCCWLLPGGTLCPCSAVSLIPPYSLTAAAEHLDGFDGEGYLLLLRHWGGASVLVLWQGGHTGKLLVKHFPS